MPSRSAVEALRKLTPEEKWRATEPLAAWYGLFESNFDPQERARRRELARRIADASRRRVSKNLDGRTRHTPTGW